MYSFKDIHDHVRSYSDYHRITHLSCSDQDFRAQIKYPGQRKDICGIGFCKRLIALFIVLQCLE